MTLYASPLTKHHLFSCLSSEDLRLTLDSMDTNGTAARRVHKRPGRSVPVDTVKLAEAIEASGLSLRELARRSGVTAAHIDGVLLGKHGIGAARLQQITAQLPVTYDSVLRG